MKKINNLIKMLYAKRLILNLGQLDQAEGVPSQIVQVLRKRVDAILHQAATSVNEMFDTASLTTRKRVSRRFIVPRLKRTVQSILAYQFYIHEKIDI